MSKPTLRSPFSAWTRRRRTKTPDRRSSTRTSRRTSTPSRGASLSATTIMWTRSYPMFNTQISDQYRVAQFKNEFNARFVVGGQPFPQFVFIWLPNDHTDMPRPSDGYAFRATYVADNDLALGKLVELFSHSPYWKDMAIFVTEDDAQDGLDHVDAPRSLLLAISPYAR